MPSTHTVHVVSVKLSDGWCDLLYDLQYDDFKKKHLNLGEDELSDKFYNEVVNTTFKEGEYADLEIEFDKKLNIVGGKVITFK